MKSGVDEISSLYDSDFNLWAQEQAVLLKGQRFQELDLAHLIEEIEDLSKRQRHAIKSQLIRLLFHLLKWQYQLAARSESWVNSVQDARTEIELLIEDSPSLQGYPAEVLETAYQKACCKNRNRSVLSPPREGERGAASSRFSPQCPLSSS